MKHKNSNTEGPGANPENTGWEKNIPKNEVFQTPPAYFDNLPLQIINRLEQNRQPSSVFGISGFAKISIAAVMSVVLLISGWYFFSDNSGSRMQQQAFSYDELLNSGLVYDFENRLLIEHYFQTTQIDSSGNAIPDNDQSINNYLIENDTDISLIINEL